MPKPQMLSISNVGAGYLASPEVKIAPRLLIAGTSFVDSEQARELCSLSVRVIRSLNQYEDFVLIDAGGAFDPKEFLPAGTEVERFGENVGAINRGGKDGAGRALCRAIEMAIAGGYDYVAVHETDFIFAKPIRPIVERMARAGVKAATPSFATPYAFYEWGVFFVDVAYAKASRLIARYDWEHSQTWPLVEIKLEQLFGDDLFMLGLRGLRNDSNQVNVATLANMFPYANCAWLTHCADHNVYVRMLELNGVYPK